MALFDHPMVPKNGTILLEDATGTPIAITIQYEDGDFSHDPFEAGYMNVLFTKDRGMDSVPVETEEQTVGFTFTATATDVGDATDKTIPDVVMKTGAFAAGVSVFGAGRPWGVKMTYTQEQSNYGAGADSSLIFAKVRLSYAYAEGLPGKFTITGRIFSPSTSITRA